MLVIVLICCVEINLECGVFVFFWCFNFESEIDLVVIKCCVKEVVGDLVVYFICVD